MPRHTGQENRAVCLQTLLCCVYLVQSCHWLGLNHPLEQHLVLLAPPPPQLHPLGQR